MSRSSGAAVSRERVAPTRRGAVLLIEPSGASQVYTVPPVLLSGCECITASSVDEALQRLDGKQLLMTLVDAFLFDTSPEEDPLARLKEHPALAGAPVVMLATTSTSTEQVELAWRAGVTDCLVRPVALPHVQGRVAALTGEVSGPAPLGRRPAPRVVLVVDGEAGFRQELARLLGLAGYRLLLAGSELEARARLAQHAGVVDAAVVRGDPLAASLVERLRSLEALASARVLRVEPMEQLGEGEGTMLARETTTPLGVLSWLDEVLQRSTRELRVHEAVSFFCPLIFRELGEDERWYSGFSCELSPGGLFIRTLVPPRVGAALEVKIWLTTSGEQIEGSGVVAWSNPWCSQGPLSAPTGMALQFLGMSPRGLARLRGFCSTSTSLG